MRHSVPSLLSRFKATAVLLLLIFCFTVYRVWIYQYPEENQHRNAFDYVCDTVGFSYHFVLLAFDVRHTGQISDYHARQALRYKPTDTYLRQYLLPGGNPK